MAIYTTFFLCTADELLNGFPGWRAPLPQPRRREFRNPFTQEMTVVETREPEWPAEEREAEIKDYRVAEIQGSYEDYLEGRLPPFVQSRPHWATKNLTHLELEPLLEAAGIGGALKAPIFSPPSSSAALEEFPPETPGTLGSLTHQGLESVAQRWAAAMSSPEFTHSVSGERIEDDWTTDDAKSLLAPIVALARKATGAERIYLLTEA